MQDKLGREKKLRFHDWYYFKASKKAVYNKTLRIKEGWG